MKKTIKTIHTTGLRLITHSVEDVSSVTLNIFVNTGSRYENEFNNGVAHFFEHMVLKGTPSRPLPHQILYDLELLGADVNAYTNREFTTYVIKILKYNLEKGVEILFDAFLHSLIDPSELEKERNVIKEELKMYEDDPSTVAEDKFIGNLYSNDPYGFDIVGSVKTLNNINSDIIKDFYRKNYFFENTVIVATGDIQHELLEQLVDKYFDTSSYSHGNVNNLDYIPQSQFIQDTNIYKKDIQQAQFRLATYSYEHSNINKYKASVAVDILGSGSGSKLFMEVREKLGLVYGIYANSLNWSKSGYVCIEAGLNPDKLELVRDICFKEMKKIALGEFSDDDIKRVKEQNKSTYLMYFDTVYNWAWYIGESEVVHNKPLDIQGYIENINKVTREDICKEMDILLNSKWQSTFVVPNSYDF